MTNLLTTVQQHMVDGGKNTAKNTKSLIPTFGLLVITVCLPKVGIKLLYKLSLARIFSVHSCQNFIPCFLTFCSTIGSLRSLLTI